MQAVTPRERGSCGQGRPALSVDEAWGRLLAGVEPVSARERVALRSALGRILAGDIHSPIDVPSHTNSAVDGYALDGSALPSSGSVALPIAGAVLAGAAYAGAVPPGACARIMTGAPLPAGTDTVIMQEHVERAGERVTVGPGHRRGENVRAAGEDLARGAAVLEQGRWITPADLGLLASIGLAEVSVFRRLRVAFFSTGDELRSIGEPLGPGLIYDSNRYTLYGMLARLGVEILDLGVVRDTRDAVLAAFRDAAGNADAIITSGGVSVGEADFVKETLEKIGRIDFWQIAMKPGRPLAFGHVDRAAFFGLPGNPVSVMVTFYEFVEPALRRMAGERIDRWPRVTLRVPCAARLRKRPDRAEFVRGVLERDANGTLIVRPTGHQGSGILRSMSLANCFILLAPDAGNVEAGDWVEVQPFYGVV